MQIDAPLTGRWSMARRVCLGLNVGAWVVFWINYFAASVDWLAYVAVGVVVVSAIALLPVLILGRKAFHHTALVAEQSRKEAERIRLSGH